MSFRLISHALVGLRCSHKPISNAALDLLVKIMPSRLLALVDADIVLAERQHHLNRGDLLSAPAFISLSSVILEVNAISQTEESVAERLASLNVCSYPFSLDCSFRFRFPAKAAKTDTIRR
jgi:hypothetical protein